MIQPRVVLLYNEPTLAATHPDAESEHDILYTVDYMSAVLNEGGCSVTRLGVVDDPSAIIAGIRAMKPDAIFNLYEGPAKWGAAEAYVAGLLELLRVPYSGCPTFTLQFARSKPLCKQLFAAAGLPSARYYAVEALQDKEFDPSPLSWPLIVKPGKEDGSIGITQKSVVTNQADLNERIRYLMTTYGPPVLVEEFILGRELTVSVWERDGELVVLPFTEVQFLEQEGQSPLWPIISFDAKWFPNSRDYKATPTKTPAEVTPELEARLSEEALRAFRLLGCRDYARIDFRVTPQGVPMILEVNPNPCISPLAAFAAALEAAKIPHAEFIRSLIRSTLIRGGKPNLAAAISTAKGKPIFLPAPTEPSISTSSDHAVNVRIRASEPGDKAAILKLMSHGESWTPEEKQLAQKQLAADPTLTGNAARKEFVLEKPEGNLVGFISTHLHGAAHGIHELDVLIVDPSVRRQKLGTLLWEHVLQKVVQDGGMWMKIDLSSGPCSASLRQFLLKMGFISTGAIPGFYLDTWDRLEFVKQLVRPASHASVAN